MSVKPPHHQCPMPILDPTSGRARDEAKRDPRFNESLARGLELLRAFTQGKAFLANHEIAQITGLPKATVSRLSYTLTQLGYLSYSAKQEKYELGIGVLSLGFGFLSNLAVRRIAKPLMQELANLTKAGVGLADRDRLDMVYIEYCTPDGVKTFLQNIGDRLGFAESAIGRAHWAALPEDEQHFLLEHLRRKHGDQWHLYESRLISAKDDLMQYGFCKSIGDWNADINGIAVPLQIEHAPIYVFNCGGPAYRISAEFLSNEVAPLLQTTVNTIKSMLINLPKGY